MFLVKAFTDTCNLVARNVQIPVGWARIGLAALLVVLLVEKTGPVCWFVIGMLYAAYVHNAIELRSLASRAIGSKLTRFTLTCVWTLGHWSWAQNEADNASDKNNGERIVRAIATWLALPALVAVLF